MFRLTDMIEFAWTPALLVAVAASWACADEPFPYPAPPARSKSVYLAPDPLPALPAPAASGKRITPSAGTRTAQALAEGAAPRGGLVPPARKSVVPDSAETDRRVDRLKRQLEELNEMLSRPPVEPPVIERLITPLPVEDHPFRPSIQHQPDPPAVVGPPAVPVPDPPAAHEPPAGHEPPSGRAVPAPPDVKLDTGKLSAKGLIKGLPTAAIDRVHVADNLFAAGEYMLANEIYEQVDRRSISSDESGWVEFQLANSARRLGRMDDAKKRYRRVVADPTLGWLQDMAKWRLDAIDEREQLIKEHARLDAAIKQVSETPRAAAKP
ncbi:MAG TPA: hypothetical protein VM452_10750 [Caulifigura sp.]|jgi:hypothetical protein|nr:hypothetical protein [Caulifigura sp.]